jgi:hypothetical protein
MRHGFSWTVAIVLGFAGLTTYPSVVAVQSALATAASRPGLVKVKAKGENSTYPVTTANLPLPTTLVLDPPAAACGLCAEPLWPTTPAARPSCALASAGSVVKCE